MDDTTPKTLWPLADEIAAHLPGAWTAHQAPKDYGPERDTRAFLRDSEGHEIRLVLGVGRYGLAPQGKIHIWGHYGEDNGKVVLPRDVGAIGYDEKPPEINISASKTPERIARDIERRFLADYLTAWAACREMIEAREAHRAAVRANAETIAERAGVGPGSITYDADGDRAYIYVPGWRIRRIEVGNDWIEFAGSIPLPDGLALVDLLREIGEKATA